MANPDTPTGRLTDAVEQELGKYRGTFYPDPDAIRWVIETLRPVLEQWEQKRTERRVAAHIGTIKAHHEIVSAKDAEIARLREALEKMKADRCELCVCRQDHRPGCQCCNDE